jgi:hypothetical protein
VLLRRPQLAPRAQTALTLISPALIILSTAVAFWFARDDPRYQADIAELASLQASLAQNASSQDIVMLSTPAYAPYFSNWYKGNPIWYNLPYSPGERASWEQEPEVVSDKVEDLISPISASIFQATFPGGPLHRGGPLRLIVDSGPFHPWSVRPPEWYLAKYTYMVGVKEFSTTVRLVSYLPLQAPDTNTRPSQLTDARFGETIRLSGYDIVSSPGSATGDMVGISLLWKAIKPVEVNYTVGIYLLDPNGVVAMQQDRWPMAGFEPTSGWKTGENVRDNYGFIIPSTLPPGDYRFAVAVYDLTTMERLAVFGPDNTAQGDLLLLETLDIH